MALSGDDVMTCQAVEEVSTGTSAPAPKARVRGLLKRRCALVVSSARAFSKESTADADDSESSSTRACSKESTPPAEAAAEAEESSAAAVTDAVCDTADSSADSQVALDDAANAAAVDETTDVNQDCESELEYADWAEDWQAEAEAADWHAEAYGEEWEQWYGQEWAYDDTWNESVAACSSTAEPNYESQVSTTCETPDHEAWSTEYDEHYAANDYEYVADVPVLSRRPSQHWKKCQEEEEVEETEKRPAGSALFFELQLAIIGYNRRREMGSTFFKSPEIQVTEEPKQVQEEPQEDEEEDEAGAVVAKKSSAKERASYARARDELAVLLSQSRA